MRYFKEKYLQNRIGEGLRIIDLGSMDVNGSYREFFNHLPWEYIGVDLSPGKNVDIVLKDPYCWREIKTNSADVLISGQAFEHIEYFWATMFEIDRVIKPGGLCCILAPSSGSEHRYPVDCWRFYPDGLAALARMIKFEVLELFTQWEDEDKYTDCSNNWHDTMLVARSTDRGGVKHLQNAIRRFMIRKVLVPA